MAIPSRQIGWGTESNLLWQILKQLNKLTSVLFGLKEAATPNYKVYTALLTQSGGDDPLSINTGVLTIGVTYMIFDNSPGMDFTNVGAPNNNLGTYFVATGLNPNNWGEYEGTGTATLVYNSGAPVATVIENTIGNIWFTYGSVGLYSIYTDSEFTQNKTFAFFAFPGGAGNGGSASIYVNQAPQNLPIETRQFDGTPSESVLYETSFEIRVYN
jgi:hypothetical protein